MPEQIRWFDDFCSDVLADTALSLHEKERRQIILNDIATRLQQTGAHVAEPHPNRARQFMPFAALKGYHELAYEQERVSEQKRTMTEEQAIELSEATSRLMLGSRVSIVHYEGDQYITTCGEMTEIDETFHFLCIEKKRIAFDNILSVETPDAGEH